MQQNYKKKKINKTLIKKIKNPCKRKKIIKSYNRENLSIIFVL